MECGNFRRIEAEGEEEEISSAYGETMKRGQQPENVGHVNILLRQFVREDNE